jgi:hypothetical protein
VGGPNPFQFQQAAADGRALNLAAAARKDCRDRSRREHRRQDCCQQPMHTDVDVPVLNWGNQPVLNEEIPHSPLLTPCASVAGWRYMCHAPHVPSEMALIGEAHGAGDE